MLESLLPTEFRAVVGPSLRRAYLGTFVNCLGSGLTLSVFVIYLHDVRHLSTGYSTILLTVAAVAGLCVSPLGGTLVDRFGPTPVLVVANLLNAGTLIVWSFVRTPIEALGGTLLIALFSSGGWGPMSTLVSRLVPEEHRTRAFGLNFMLLNLGIGFGMLISALIVNLADPFSFQLLYWGDAGTSVLQALIFLTLWGQGHRTEKIPEHLEDEGWAVVVRDRALLQYVLASIILVIGGYASMDAGLSLFIVNVLHISVHSIGVIFFFNTTTIVLGQLFVLKRIEGRSRTGVLAGTAVMWASFWLLLALALVLSHWLAIGLLCLGMVVFAIGETMMQPMGPSIVNAMAPDHLRGRYNAAASLSWSLSGMLAPAIVSLYYVTNVSGWWPFGTALVALAGGGAMLNLRRHLSAEADGRPGGAQRQWRVRRAASTTDAA